MNSINKIFSNFEEININHMNSQLSFIHMNIRSLRKNFLPLISHIHNITNKIHMIILTETNITDDENQFFVIQGFNSIFLNRAGRGGGIAVFIKENINYETITINTKSYETLRIDITINKQKIVVIPVYRPPCQNINAFINELDQAISIVSKKKETIIIGDMNIDIKKVNATTTMYLDMLSSYGLQCLVTATTREDEKNKTSTCIDHMFIRCNRSHAEAAVVTTTISDHYAVFGYIEEEGKQNNKYVANTQGSENLKISNKKVNCFIKEIDWNAILNRSNSTTELFNNIFKAFCYIYENSQAEKLTIKKRKDYPWLCDVLLKCCKIRDKLHKKWLKNKNNELNNTIYKKFNNNLNKKIKNARNVYYRNQFIRNRNNMRVTWQIINEITNKKTNNIDETIKKNFQGEDLAKVSEKFALKFKENIEKTVHSCNIKTINNTNENVENSFYLTYTDEVEIFNILKGLNARKSAGADGIRSIDLKNNARYLTPVLTALINSSISESIVPNILKSSIIRPIYKSGKKTDHNNYRPIAILSVVEKVLEEVIVRRLTGFLNKFNIIHDNQFGFQKGKNINQLLGLFSNHVNQSLGNKMHCLALFVDFSKAFDTLSHSKLIEILERNGIRGQCIEWFKDYLSCRTYRVKIENNISENTTSTHGVPQGSKLGPILYIIYANDLMKLLKNSTAFAYADDTAVIVSHQCIVSATNIMQNELNILAKWCHDRGLIINATKTKIMHFRPRHIARTNMKPIFHNTECLHRTANTNITQSNDTCSEKIEIVDTYKYLGIHLDEHFKWKTHTDVLHKKLRKSSYALYHIGNCAPYSVLRQAYFSLAESYLRHGITAWGTSTYCKSLQITQNRLLKQLYINKHALNRNSFYTNNNNMQTQQYIDSTRSNRNNNNYNQRYTNTKQLYEDLHILNINKIYQTTIINEFYNDTKLLQQLDHDQNTRSKTQGRYKIPRFQNNYQKNSLAVTLPSSLNQLPNYLLRITNKLRRKKLIKKHFLNA